MWGRLTDIVTDRHTEKQADRQTSRQTDRQTDRHMTYLLFPYVLAKPYLASLFHDPVKRGERGESGGKEEGMHAR